MRGVLFQDRAPNQQENELKEANEERKKATFFASLYSSNYGSQEFLKAKIFSGLTRRPSISCVCLFICHK